MSHETAPLARGYEFTNAWFENTAKPVWENFIPAFGPRRILEIGSYEGKSACFLIDTLAKRFPIEAHCVDTWEGGIEHQDAGIDMGPVEQRFHRNVALARACAPFPVDLRVHKGYSDVLSPRLLCDLGQNYFDLVYIDGSHQAPDVLFDALLGFKLTRIGGAMIFDDYNWWENLPGGKDLLRMPKPAIDAFVNINIRKVNVLNSPLSQLFVEKLSD